MLPHPSPLYVIVLHASHTLYVPSYSLASPPLTFSPIFAFSLPIYSHFFMHIYIKFCVHICTCMFFAGTEYIHLDHFFVSAASHHSRGDEYLNSVGKKPPKKSKYSWTPPDAYTTYIIQ